MLEAATRDALGLVGSLLDKKYRVDRRVAEGGFGVVYAGRHIGLGRAVAIKVPKRPPETSAAEWGDMVGKFLEEARLAAKLRHPAVVGVLDAGITPTDSHPEGLAWIAMEWLDGETLAEDLARRRTRTDPPRTRAETLELMRPVIDAIAEAHHAGIIHRDVNPNNVMLVPGRVTTAARILDFGIAKVMVPESTSPSPHTTSRAGDRAFSLAYAAPEQLSGARTGPWTDVHALGLLLTELLCGKPALPADDLDAHYRAVFSPVRPTPATMGVDVGDWEPVLARALALDAKARYPTASELLAALEGPPASASMPSAPVTTRRRIPWLAIGAVVAVAGAAGAWAALRESSEPEPPPPPVAACASNAACSTPGSPGVCRPAGCVALRSADCEPFADDAALASDATVWIGGLFPRKEAWGAREGHALELARRDFAQIMSGTTRTGDRARPLGLLACDDSVDDKRAARHLVEVGAPAVIGLSTGERAIDLTSNVFVPNKVLAVASLTTNRLVTQVPHPAGVPRLVWRTTYLSGEAGAAIAAFIAADEPALRAVRRELRIALVRPRSAAGDALNSTLLNLLRFNDRSALENRSNYLDLTTETEAPAGSPEYPRIQRALLAFQPDIIIYAAPVAIVDETFAPLEAQWPAGARRPRYISIAALPQTLIEFVGKNRDRRGRFFGVTPLSSNRANVRFVTHYKEVFPTDDVTLTNNPNSSYDAFYLVAYASYTIPAGEPVTGPGLSRGIAKLVPPGRPIEVGFTDMFDAYAALRDGSIDLTGATGKLDFDLATGEAAFDQAVLCAALDESGKLAGVESGLVYRASSKQLEGKLRCN